MIVRIGLALAIVTVAAFAICGCWLPAVELAPLAISAAEGVGSTVFGLAEGTVVMAHQGNEQVPDSSDEDGMDREDRCEELETDVPGVIELRRGPNGEPEYRELELGGSLDEPRWTVRESQDTSADGWRPAAALLRMNFTPPLSDAIPAKGSNYLAYRSAQLPDAIAENSLVPLSVNFGAIDGTFESGGQQYQFAMTHKLPCFPSPL